MTRRSFYEKRLEEKLRVIFMALVAVLLALILLAFLLSSYFTAQEQAGELAKAQVSASERLYQSWFAEMQHAALSVIMDIDVQEYCKRALDSAANAADDYELNARVRNTLQNALHMSEDIAFFAVVRSNISDGFVSRGTFAVTNADFLNLYRALPTQLCPALQRGALSYAYVNGVLRNETAFIMTHPVFSTEKVFKRLGTLVMYLSDRVFKNTFSSSQSLVDNTVLTDLEGRVITASADTSAFVPIDYAGAEEGHVLGGLQDTYFKRVEGWNYYVVCEISRTELMRPVLRSAVVVVAVTGVLLLLSILFIRHVVSKNCRPLQIVVGAMKHVQQGDLSRRVHTDDVGEDFRALENGYNDMMDTIDRLFVRIRKEQHQADQIRFNALQSQIQPHFLYNTLECIHWQARAEGDTHTSEMVQELANYYRICLSKGKEIIPLWQELEHIRLYLTIQTKRYGSIINYSVDVPDELREILIPKLTLQPLVENSIYHGIRVKEGLRGEIHVSACATEDGCCIVESDNGLGMSDEDIDAMNASISDYSKDFGYGIRNVNRRIELYFGTEYGLEYSRNASGGVTATIYLPRKFGEETNPSGLEA